MAKYSDVLAPTHPIEQIMYESSSVIYEVYITGITDLPLTNGNEPDLES